MKKLFTLFLLTTFLSCGSMYITKDYGSVKGWGYKEMPPSQVTASGDTFYEFKLTSDRTYSVGGGIDDPDATYYYNALYQDLGWWKKVGGNWEAEYNTHRPKNGHLYFSSKRGVAVYFYPKGTFDVFKVTLNTTEED